MERSTLNQQDVLLRPASSYMNRLFVTVDENVDVAAGVRQMTAQKAEAIIATRKGMPVGIITDSDILNKIVMKGEDSAGVMLKTIMSDSIISLSTRATVEQALQLMRVNQIKRVAIRDEAGLVIGIVNQRTLADAIRTSVLEKTFRKYRSAIREQYKPIIGNLGILLQFSGILLVVPAFFGTAIGEAGSVAGIYLAVVGLSFTGFFLMSVGERGPMNLKQASIFILVSFIVLSLFGSLPYAYTNPFGKGIDVPSLFVNSFFESASGFTTTGLSLIDKPENLPQSVDFYRSYTQWVGGLSFVYLIMTIFYPEKKLNAMKALFGGGLLRFKEFLITLVVVFSLYTIVLSFLLVFLTQLNDVDAVSLVFSTITSGGFVPVSNIVSQAQPEVLAILTIGMILSALPFAFHYNLFYKGGMLKKAGLTPEVKVYLALMSACIPLFYLISYGSGQQSVDPISASFHVISGSTTTGFQYMNISSLPGASKIFMIVLMLIGGTAFSTAGGIKVGRFLVLYHEFFDKGGSRKAGKNASSEKNNVLERPENGANGTVPHPAPRFDTTLTSISSSTNLEGDSRRIGQGEEEYRVSDFIDLVERRGKRLYQIKQILRIKIVKEILIVIVLYISIPFISATVISSLADGTSFDNALFESVSAITTTGLTAGVTATTLDLTSKLILTANMIAGRLEIIAILYIFFRSLRR